jgi:hypothetical protein
MGIAHREDVHAYHDGGESVIEIRTLIVRRYVGMKASDVSKAVLIVAENSEKLLREWRRIHGS